MKSLTYTFHKCQGYERQRIGGTVTDRRTIKTQVRATWGLRKMALTKKTGDVKIISVD
jgi:hypothetical protein